MGGLKGFSGMIAKLNANDESRKVYISDRKVARTFNRAKLRPRFHCGDLEQEMAKTIRNIVI
jgi:hypothetical protein